MAGIDAINKAVEEGLQPSLSEILMEKLEHSLTFKDSQGRGGTLFPSTLGNQCDRYLWLHYHGKLPGMEGNAKLRRIFDHGKTTEDRFHKYFNNVDRTGIILGRELVVKGVIGKGQWKISGRADFVLSVNATPVIFELKTIKKDDFDRLISPKHEHAVQLQIYLNLNLQGIKDGIVGYECKDNQEIKMFDLVRSESVVKNLAARADRVLPMSKPPRIEEVESIHEYYCDCRKVKDNEFE